MVLVRGAASIDQQELIFRLVFFFGHLYKKKRKRKEAGRDVSALVHDAASRAAAQDD